MPPPNDANRDRPENVTSWLVIPYFDDDVGRQGVERPIPAGKAISWLCRSIIVNGQPGGTSFARGVPISIELDVANWGSGVLPAATLVRLWWADPSLAFSAATLIGQTTVMVPTTGVAVRVGTFRVTIPVGASAHVCLLAQVSAPLDGSTGVPNPHADRHWAQLNLVETTDVGDDGTIILPILLGNPFATAARSRVTIAPMSTEETRLLSTARGIDIRADGEAELVDGGLEPIELPPNRSMRATVKVRLAERPGGGAPQGYVLTQQLRPEHGDERDVLEGTLGLLVGGD